MGLIPLKVGMNHEDLVGYVLREAKRRKLPVLKKKHQHGVINNNALVDSLIPNAFSLFFGPQKTNADINVSIFERAKEAIGGFI